MVASRYDAKMRFGRKGTYSESTGLWTDGGDEYEAVCRASPASSGSKLFHAGMEISYYFNIAFPLGSNPLPKAGDEVKIYGTRNDLIFEGIMLRVHYGTYSIRAWV